MADGTPALLERELELGELHSMMAAAARGQGGAAVLEGPAGIGKTQLLLAAVEAAPALGLRPLVARAGELERDLAFGVARQLLEAPVRAAARDARATLLEGPARRAAAVLELAEGAPEDTEPAAAAHGLFWLLANLAAQAPVLLAVDDVHWADGPSVRFLAYLGRRLADLPVAVVCTLRTGEPVDDALDALLAETGLRRLRPEPLHEAAVARILSQRLGEPVDPAFAAACRARTAGNPFLLAELISEIAARGLRPTRAGAAGLEDILPERVEAAVRRRLATVGADARALAVALVVLGDGVEPGLAAALAGLKADAGAEAVVRLAGADLLEPGAALRFRHPLVRAAVAATVGDAERGRGHARAARLLAERGASPARLSAHLLASPTGDGDQWVVSVLRAAAHAVRRQGAPEHAIEPLRRALAEPADPHVRAALLRELGGAELAAMQPAAAEHLQAALDAERDPGVRADVALELGMALYTARRHAAAVDVLVGAIEELGATPARREQRLVLEAFLAIVGRYDLATEAAVRGRIHRVAAGLEGATPGERLVLAVAAVEDPGPTAAGLARAARLQEAGVDEVPWPEPAEGVGIVAMYLHAGEPEPARRLAERLLERARRADSPTRHAIALLARASVQLDCGALAEAEADARAALSDPSVAGGPPVRRSGVGLLAGILAERGELAEADALLAEHHLDGDLPEQMVLNPLLHARAGLRLAQGRFTDALADARELGRRYERWGMRRPSPNWRALAAEALRALDAPAEARELAEVALELARTWNTPKAIAIALRARALAADDAAGRIADLREASAVLDGTPWRLERARVELDLGAALRRAGARRDARERLAAAMDAATRCDAAGLAARAAQELRATGARPRRHAVTGRDALTASERRVAALAARGRSNRAIAQELFVTVATVETHLRRVYRKLDVEGRSGLAEALTEDAADSA
jgi:DNA-binding CsgD family transcriptional regulator